MIQARSLRIASAVSPATASALLQSAIDFAIFTTDLSLRITS